MPIVPRIDQQVTANTLPNAQFNAPSMPDVAGAQLRQFAQGAGQFGESLTKIENEQQRQADQLRVDDALNRAKETALKLTYDKDSGFTNIKGRDALERSSGKPLADEYADTLREQVSKLSNGLSNDNQRRAFAQHSNNILTSFHGQAMQHEAGEFKTYSLSVSEGVQSTAIQEIGLNWNNPEAIDKAVRRIEAETYRQAQVLGKSAEWQEAQARKLTSNAHKVALMSALEQSDPGYADAYLKKYSKQMDADDILQVRGHITKETDAKVSGTAVGDVIGKLAPRFQTGDGERAFNVALGTESNYQQFGKDGKPLTSPKGAIGIAQVMPGTAPEAAKLAGLPWDENRYKTDPAYNKAIGLAYFQKQLQETGGDVQKAWAAYNAGPGRLQEGIKKAEKNNALAKNDPSIGVKTWLDFMPKETQDYVAKNSKAYEAGQGSNPRATLADVERELRADPRIADNPQRLKIALADASHRVSTMEAERKNKDDEAVSNAMRAIIQNGGRFTDLPPAVRAGIPPKEVDNLIGFAQKVSKGDDSTSPWLYNKLANDSGYLASLTDNSFFALRRELSETDFKHFSNERAKLSGKTPGSQGPGDLNSQAIKSVLDQRMRMLKIDPTPKDDGGDDASRVGAMRQFVDQYFMSAQRESGKKFSDAEVSAHIDALFAKNTTFRGFFSNSSGPMMTMKAGDIDSAAKDSIKAAYKRQGVDNPTDAQILIAYWNTKVARK